MSEGYAVYVSGTTHPVPVRVYNFTPVDVVTKVISGIRYMSSIVVDGDILVSCAAGGKYGAIHLSSFGNDEVKAIKCITSIIEAYPDFARMDMIYEMMVHPVDGDSGDVIVYIPAIRVSSASFVEKMETDSLVGKDVGKEGGWRKKLMPLIELLFVGAMLIIIVCLILACSIIYMVTDG